MFTPVMLLDDNPRRRTHRRKHHRKGVMPAGLKAYWANRRRRKTHKRKVRVGKKRFLMIGPLGKRKKLTSNTHRLTRSTNMPKHRGHKRRFHRNPAFSLKGLAGGLGSQLKVAATGAVGIAANKFLANQVSKLIKIDPRNKQLVELGSALFLFPLLAKVTKVGMLRTAAPIAAASALYDAAKNFLPAAVQAQLSGDEFSLGPAYTTGQQVHGLPATNIDIGLQGDILGMLPVMPLN